jgi:hypothetical protein
MLRYFFLFKHLLLLSFFSLVHLTSSYSQNFNLIKIILKYYHIFYHSMLHAGGMIWIAFGVYHSVLLSIRISTWIGTNSDIFINWRYVENWLFNGKTSKKIA